MLSSDEIVPLYASLERIVDKPHTLLEELQKLSDRFPRSPGIQGAIDILLDRLGNFLFREEDSEIIVKLHRKAIRLTGETLIMTGQVLDTEVAVAIQMALESGGERKYQKMDEEGPPAMDGIDRHLWAAKKFFTDPSAPPPPPYRKSSSVGLFFHEEFKRLFPDVQKIHSTPSGLHPPFEPAYRRVLSEGGGMNINIGWVLEEDILRFWAIGALHSELPEEDQQYVRHRIQAPPDVPLLLMDLSSLFRADSWGKDHLENLLASLVVQGTKVAGLHNPEKPWLTSDITLGYSEEEGVCVAKDEKTALEWLRS